MEHYYSEKPESELKIYEIPLNVLGLNCKILSASGLFSKKKIDYGTRVLIENCIIKDNDYVLDLGCGYGAIGIALALTKNIKVLMSDINERAIMIAKMNVKRFNLRDKVKVIKSNGFEKIKDKFDVILWNPPQTAGKKLCFRLIEEAKDHLKINGSLQLVARHNKGGKSLMEKMKEVFNNVTTIAKYGGYRVYLSYKK